MQSNLRMIIFHGHYSQKGDTMVPSIVMHQRAFYKRFFTFTTLVLVFYTSAIAQDAQLPTDPQTALQSGITLEQQRNWREAIRTYTSALKKWKGDEGLKLGLRRARFQYSIDRRYLDESFKVSLKPMSREAALSLFDDVLTNIQGYFVDRVDVGTIVAHGTESLWLALGNEKFVEENLFGASEEKIQKVRQALFQRYWNKPIPHRFAAQQIVGEICDLCMAELGLECGPVIMEYTFGACNCLDDYSNVLTPTRRKDLNGNIKGEFVGIGIVMEGELGEGMGLQQIIPKSPAAEAGLKRGDFITAVDGTDCRFLSTEEAATLLTGLSGSTVELTIKRNSDVPFNTRCSRRAVKVSSVAVAKIIDSQNGIGYIQMTGFQQNTVRELDAALYSLQQQGMKALIWDLRENPGGLLDAAIEVVDRFIARGVIVSTKGRASDQTSTHTAHQAGTWDIPLTLLIDENSASASEIVAGAIRDHNRGKIVGRTSFGKWSVQTIFEARFGTSIRLTTAKFYSPNGNTWGKVGLDPDILIENGPENRPLGDVDIPNDPDLQAALQVLTAQEFTKR
ncbi:S41 family peptidase [Planctomicrobium sp.]|jgi:carboxyl-terminal processing protease|nr:S41 family peptidase [Planctomicrobium sp.]MBT5021132.1 S41 family peptidase [Planctomicrobium sp.]MDB4731219.1 S41 family peptidase [bacterium]MDB4742863.1 S41 family peptidase [Planctomicrobium sp.]